MKFKIIILFAALNILFLSAFVFQSVSREKQSSILFLKKYTTSQVHHVNQILQNEISQMKLEILQLSNSHTQLSKAESLKNLNRLNVVGALNIDTNELLWQVGAEKNSDLEFWINKAKEIPPYDKNPRFFSKKNQGENMENDSQIGYFFINDSTRLFGIIKSQSFQNIITNSDEKLDSNLQFLLFNQRGLTIGHSVSDYIGNSLIGDKLFEDIRKTRLPIGELTYKDFKSNPVISIYETIPDTDLTLTAQVKPLQWAQLDWSYYGQTFFIFLGVIGIATWILIMIVPESWGTHKNNFSYTAYNSSSQIRDMSKNSTPEELNSQNNFELSSFIDETEENSEFISHPLQSVPPIPKEIPQVPTVELGPKVVPQIPSQIIEKISRMSTLDSISTTSTINPEKLSVLAKIITQMKAPLLSILGHVQLAKSQSHNTMSLNAIEQEARSAREQLDRLGNYCGLSHNPSVTIKISELIEAALRLVESQIVRGSVRVQKNIETDFAVKCDTEDLKNVLLNVFKNSIESMEHVLKKELIISVVRKDETHFKIEVKDSGEGILPANVKNIFEPFYSTKSPLDFKGLGLASSLGIVKKHLGDINIHSNPSEGTSVQITLPISLEKAKTLADIQLQQRPQWLDLVSIPSTSKSKNTKSNTTSTLESQQTSKSITKNVDVDFEIKDLNFKEDDFAFNNELKPSSKNIHSKVDLKVEAPTVNNSAQQPTAPEITNKIQDKNLESIIETIQITSSKKRLKKNDEPLDMIKVQIPNPEEKSNWT